MIMAIGIFVGTLLALFLLDRLTGIGEAWFRGYRRFAFYHIALLFASAIMIDRLLGKTQPEMMYSIFIGAAVVGIIWAGLLERAQQRRDL